jgi:regulator of sigma E protease
MLSGTGFAILGFFLVIGPLIFVHELGHFLAARWSGIKVEEFGIGYPPRIMTLFEQGGTKFTLNWIPLGGFMKPAGEDDPLITGGFGAAPKAARLFVLFAGPGANILLAFFLLIAMFMIGAPEPLPGALIVVVEDGTPAQAAGLLPDDVVTYADNTYIDQSTTLTDYIYSHIGETITLTIERGGETFETSLTLRTEWPEDQGPTGIQITSTGMEMVRYDFFPAINRTFEELGILMKAFIDVPAAVVRQQIPARYLRPVSPIGISQLGGQAIEASIDQSVLWPVIQLTAFISIALGITNLLPLPALDGGRILFILIEFVRGRRVDPQREAIVHLIGFALLLTAMIVFVYLDIVDPLITP